MPLIYITGISGSGKSSVCKELKHRGYVAYDTDHDGIAFFYHNETDEPVLEKIAPEDRTPEWRTKHTWKAKREDVEKLAAEAKGKLVFLCGVTNNDADELWDLFDHVFALTLDEEGLRHRIINRTSNDFGKNEHEFTDLLRWQQTASEDYKKLGATLIDATKPLDEVIDEILHRSIDFAQTGRDSLRTFVQTIKKLAEREEAFDAIAAAGDSGQLTARITEEVYKQLDTPIPPKLVAPIYRHADEAETILFDNSILAPQFEAWKTKPLKNILFVDDEIGGGNAVRGMLDLLLELSPGVQAFTIVAEDGRFDCPPEIHGVKTVFIPTRQRIPNVYNAISYTVPWKFQQPLKEVLADEPDLNNKQVMCTLLGLPTKEFNNGKPTFNDRLIERAQAKLPDFTALQKEYQEYFANSIRSLL